jgi:hypothetical protein
MNKSFEGVMELYSSDVQRNKNGKSQVLVFECEENLEMEKELIEFRDESVKISIVSEEEDAPDIELTGTMAVDVKTRKASSLRKLCLILKGMYSKEFEHSIIDIKFHDCTVKLSSIDNELEFDEDEEQDED